MVDYNKIDYNKLDNIVGLTLKTIYEKSSTDGRIILTDFSFNSPEDLCIFEIAKIAQNIWNFPIYIEGLTLANKIRLKKKTKTKRNIEKATKKLIQMDTYINCINIRNKVAQTLKIDAKKDFVLIYEAYYKR